VYRELADLGERAREAVASRTDKGKGLERVVAESLGD
jgi:hypothetical protein